MTTPRRVFAYLLPEVAPLVREMLRPIASIVAEQPAGYGYPDGTLRLELESPSWPPGPCTRAELMLSRRNDATASSVNLTVRLP